MRKGKMDERPIDTHESKRKKTGRSLGGSKVNQWIHAWTACYEIVQDYSHSDLKQFHSVFEHWVPILNWIFERPIRHLDVYEAYFYYYEQPNGPKEIIQLYMEPDLVEGGTTVHIIFNLHEFQIIHRRSCDQLAKSNQMLFNEARGTVNLSTLLDDEMNTAEYFESMTCWQLLFIYTLHALAHWDVYDSYKHAHYDNHQHMKESAFYKFYCCGDLIHK